MVRSLLWSMWIAEIALVCLQALQASFTARNKLEELVENLLDKDMEWLSDFVNHSKWRLA